MPSVHCTGKLSAMNVLGICGSPNADGNTAHAVKYGLSVISALGFDTRCIELHDKEIHPCRACWSCVKTRRCRIEDDMQMIHEALRWSDGVVFGSPVYFGMVSGQMKVMMDRCVVFRSGTDLDFELHGKVGCGIACGGFRNGGQETTLQNIQTFFLQQGMIVINDGPFLSHAGGTIVGNAREDGVGLKTIGNMMNNLAATLSAGTRR